MNKTSGMWRDLENFQFNTQIVNFLLEIKIILENKIYPFCDYACMSCWHWKSITNLKRGENEFAHCNIECLNHLQIRSKINFKNADTMNMHDQR